MKFETWRMAWKMFTRKEQKQTVLALLVMAIAAIAQTVMIGSVLPFLSALSDPAKIHEDLALSSLYKAMGLETDFTFVIALGILTVAVIVMASLIQFLRVLVVARFIFMRVHDLSTRLARSYFKRDYDYFLTRNSADISKRILAETTEVMNSFMVPATELVSGSLVSLSILALLLTVEPTVTIVGACLFTSIYVVIYLLVGKKVSALGHERVKANKERFIAVNEAFNGIKDVKVTGKEDVFFQRLLNASYSLMMTQSKNRVLSESPRTLIQMVFFASVVLACLLLIEPSNFDVQGASPLASIIPTLGLFALAGQKLIPEMQRAYAAITKIAYAGGAIRNVYEEMDLSLLDGYVEKTVSKMGFHDSIELADVSYHYTGSETGGLKHISTRIRKGEKIGIVGGTGAGKTTFVDVLLGLLVPSSGSVKVDGIPIAENDARAAWQAGIGYVPQSSFILDASLAENIAFGESLDEIDWEKMKDAARIAQIDTFIETQTQDGYMTPAGDRGTALSGGQRQRIALARALYRGADVLVLDEATSALDPATENEIMSAIEALPETITVIMIAHRLETVKPCDRLLVLKDGKLVEEGSFDKLAQKGGVFSKLARM
jgi:ABC-type multidrug transport system fused ATPase/permease subunit